MKTTSLVDARPPGLAAAIGAYVSDKCRHVRAHGRFDLAWRASAFGLGLWAAAFGAAALGLVAATGALYPVGAASVIALYALGACAERAFPNAADARSTRTLVLAVLALLSFLAHGQAAGEVNAIFHVDAAAFPHATAAATAFVVLSWLFWPAAAAVAASVCGAALALHRKAAVHAVTGLTILLGSATLAGAIAQQFRDTGTRANDIYQVARALDFNERFECDRGVPGVDGAAFIGPEQARALIAPPLVVAARGAWTRRVEIPARFAVAACR
jgi:hypothetical protein